MFTVGEKILYPMHGAGEIQKIEEKDILGQIRRYYILRLPYGNMDVMIPVDASESIGVRPVIDKDQISKVYDVLRDGSSEMSGNWNRRNRDNMEKLKTGDIMEVAEVVRNLLRIDRVRKLSTGEKKMLTNARQILESELVLAGDNTMVEVSRMVEEAV